MGFFLVLAKFARCGNPSLRVETTREENWNKWASRTSLYTVCFFGCIPELNKDLRRIGNISAI